MICGKLSLKGRRYSLKWKSWEDPSTV